MPVNVFDDDDVRRLLDAPAAVRATRAALLAHHHGTLQAPPRVAADLGDGRLVFTAGQLKAAGLFGFRAYDTLGDNEQLVAVWDRADGRLCTVVHGAELGPRRTGAIGAVAADAAANPGPVRLGLIGAGPQAWAQLWALRAVRRIEHVAVTARRPRSAAAFAGRAAQELGVPVHAVDGAREAVRGRNVVITATDSVVPVLQADWIAPGTHVSTLGAKGVAAHEVPPALLERADVVLTDSVAQIKDSPELLPCSPDRLVELGAVLAGAAAGRTAPEQITVFLSVGLAGTEVAVAAALRSEG